MQRSLKYVIPVAAVLAVLPALGFALTISGQVRMNGWAPMGPLRVTGPNATCTVPDGSGNYSCTVPTGWNGTIAAYGDGFQFVASGGSADTAHRQGSHTFTNVGTSVAGIDFSASPASGVRAELGVYRPGAHRFFLDYNFDRAPDVRPYFGVTGDVPLVGDLNGDGISDLVVYRNGTWFVDYSPDDVPTTEATFDFGGPGDTPLLADMDGDGTADRVIFRAGAWFVGSGPLASGAPRYFFGQAGDKPVLGDFNGDGIVDLAVFRNGTWYIDTNRDGIVDITVAFGLTGDLPVAADFNGDGRTDIAVFRNGTWFIDVDLDGIPDLVVQYGVAGDIPVAGFFNRANTRFVKAGSACVTGCTQANPYGTVTAAWQDAVDGDIIRIAKGTYAENLQFSYPGVQYAFNKFGKNAIKLIGVSRNSVVVSPVSGDAIALSGATGYFVRGMTLKSLGTGGRGLVLVGGPDSSDPNVISFPGAQVNVGNTDIVENDGPNVLLTGAASAWLHNDRMSRSRTHNGLSLWNHSYASVEWSEASGNGYTLAATPMPADGEGFDVRDTSELDARRDVVAQNAKFGVVGINQSKVTLISSAVGANGYNGVIFCAPGASETVSSNLWGNYISGNGTADPTTGYNGVEIFLSCTGTHQLTGNTIVGNSGNGLFVGSGTVSVIGNYLGQNVVGAILFADDGALSGFASAMNPVVTVYGNTFQANVKHGLFGEREGNGGKIVSATIGGNGQPNIFRDHTDFRYAAIGCHQLTTQFACPAGGNTFINNITNVDPNTCPASCQQ